MDVPQLDECSHSTNSIARTDCERARERYGEVVVCSARAYYEVRKALRGDWEEVDVVVHKPVGSVVQVRFSGEETERLREVIGRGNWGDYIRDAVLERASLKS